MTKDLSEKDLSEKAAGRLLQIADRGHFAKPDTSVVPAATGCRVLLEWPDGARLTLMLLSLDLTEINRLCSDFWRS